MGALECPVPSVVDAQNPVDNVLVLDASDDFDRPTTAIANVSCILPHYLALKCLIKRSSNMAMVKTRKGV